VFSDECYSEIYTRRPPAGMLEAGVADFANVVQFQSLSKRSNLPGLRIGFAAGDKSFLARFLELRNVAAPQVPTPMQHVAIAAYGDEAHVRRTAGSIRRSSISPTRSSATATATGGRAAGSSSGSTCRRRAATRRSRCGCGKKPGCGSYPAAIWRAIRPTAPIRASATSASPWCTTRQTTAEALHRLVAVLG
jgi:hypothetical protein